MRVRDIMTRQIAKAQPDTTLEEIAMMMKTENTGAIPVVDENELIGIITDRDIVVRCVADSGDPTVVTAEDIVSEEVETIDPEAELDEALELMSQKQIRRLPVVDTRGELVGMLAIGDVAVKPGEQEQTGRALNDISQGAKSSRRPQAEAARRERRVIPFRPDTNQAHRGQKKSSKHKAS
jgi:CBS domain-containing protein